MNTINSVGGIKDLAFFKPDASSSVKKEGAFESFLDSAMKVLEETNKSQLESEQMYMDLATGKTDDILAVVLAQEKATASLNFTVQVTTKIIDAYREIMRMQM